MGFSPTVPPTTDIPGPSVEKNLDTYQMTRLDILMDPQDSSNITVRCEWTRGYMDEGTYVAVDKGNATLSGQAVSDKVAAQTTGSHSLYYEVKKAVWELLQAGEFLPEGSIV